MKYKSLVWKTKGIVSVKSLGRAATPEGCTVESAAPVLPVLLKKKKEIEREYSGLLAWLITSLKIES